jgi:hypothetical protein
LLNFKDHFAKEKSKSLCKNNQTLLPMIFFIQVAFFKVFCSYKELPPFLMQIEKKLVLRRLNPHRKIVVLFEVEHTLYSSIAFFD